MFILEAFSRGGKGHLRGG